MAIVDSIPPFISLPTQHNFRDLTGQVFGRLTVLGLVTTTPAIAAVRRHLKEGE